MSKTNFVLTQISFLVMNKIINGDSLKVLKKLEDESVDLICTDPPYGYSFMGKDWDKVVPSVEIWKECLRVLKPGGFCFVMSAPRIDVQSRMGTKLEDAGFQTNFSPIYWTYATGFPKATNVGKLADKKNYDEAKNLDGSYVGYQPKPAVEVVLVAMKPITEKTTLEQAMKNGKGVTWLDDCRIPYNLESDDPRIGKNYSHNASADYKPGQTKNNNNGELQTLHNEDGRFAANLIVQDDVLNDGVKRSKGKHTDSGSASGGIWQESTGKPAGRTYGDEGSFSRFYDLDSWWKSQIHKLPESVQKTFPFMIVAKASKAEKNKGLEHLPKKKSSSMPGRRNAEDMSNSKIDHDVTGRFVTEKQNVHPTVKPIELMSYLITLGSRENDVVVDPFVGSGTTCIAAKMLDRKYIGIEKEKDYAIIAKARVEDAESPNQASEKNKSKDFFAF